MKFLSASLLLSALVGTNAAANNAETANENKYEKGLSGEIINQYLHDGSVFNENIRYEGTCADQSHCLGFTVREVQRRCGSGSCEYYVCYYTEIGHVSADVFTSSYMSNGWNGNLAAEATLDECKQHPEYGVDYAGNINTLSPDEDTGGCLNTANPKGKGLWDETCINPEVADASTGITTVMLKNRFSDFCQVVAPGHTVHFMMHSYNRLDWNGLNPAPVSCSGSAEVIASGGEADKFGSSKCAPSSQNGPYGQTYFPATDGSSGGTCSDQPEGDECVWSYTAPNECRYEENNPTCHITQASVDTVTSLCPGHSVVEYYDHANNPNDPPPRIPIHDIAHNGDGTVSFQIYNPYGNYSEPIDYGQGSPTEFDYLYGPGGSSDFADLYVVYDQANEIGNEVCELETAAGKCPSDNTYTAYCRSDGVSVVTVFASGMDATSSAAQQITNGEGTEVFECCPTSYDPNFTKASTAAWTFLIHCDCPDDNAQDRRQLRKEDISAKFQRGELFSENQKKLHKLL